MVSFPFPFQAFGSVGGYQVGMGVPWASLVLPISTEEVDGLTLVSYSLLRFLN